jgi:hypothetical protein
MSSEPQTLDGMTWEVWQSLPNATRAQLKDRSGLTPQLHGLEGWRVEVETTYGERRRFIVGVSTGWKPCHIELARRTSSGGVGADLTYKSVRALYKVR